jgi:hypothetical protein
MEAEEALRLEAVTRQQVKTADWEDLVCAVVNCIVYKLVIVPKLLVVTIC